MVCSKKKYYIFIILIAVFMAFSCTGGFFCQSIDTVVAQTIADNKVIQQKLKEMGYYNGTVDGIIGWETTQSIKQFQKKYGLVADGIVGTETSRLLGVHLTSQNSNDLYLLAKCVFAEARGEPYVGQVAVAAVILNRVRDPGFPNTIYGVVYQPWAFTAVVDGQIGLEPNATAYQAAQDALNGWDPTYGCLFYYNPVTATNQWIFNKPIVISIGKHVFAK